MNEKSFERKFGIPKESEKSQEDESKNFRNLGDPEATEYVRKELLEDLTEKYTKDERFKGTLRELEKIAQEQGLEGIVISIGGFIGRGGYTVIRGKDKKTFKVIKSEKNKVMIGEDCLENIRDLFRTDREFAQGGFGDIFCHEKQEFEGPAGKATESEFLEFEEFLKEAKDYDEVVKKKKELESYYHPKTERQVELQRIVKTYKDLDFKQEEDLNKFIEREARHLITTEFYSKGLSYLMKIKYNAEIMELVEIYDFIKPNLHKPIIKRMEEMRQGLLKKYDELKSKE